MRKCGLEVGQNYPLLPERLERPPGAKIRLRQTYRDFLGTLYDRFLLCFCCATLKIPEFLEYFRLKTGCFYEKSLTAQVELFYTDVLFHRTARNLCRPVDTIFPKNGLTPAH